MQGLSTEDLTCAYWLDLHARVCIWHFTNMYFSTKGAHSCKRTVPHQWAHLYKWAVLAANTPTNVHLPTSEDSCLPMSLSLPMEYSSTNGVLLCWGRGFTDHVHIYSSLIFMNPIAVDLLNIIYDAWQTLQAYLPPWYHPKTCIVLKGNGGKGCTWALQVEKQRAFGRPACSA